MKRVACNDKQSPDSAVLLSIRVFCVSHSLILVFHLATSLFWFTLAALISIVFKENSFDNPTIDYLLSTKQQTKQLADEPNEWILDLLYVQVQTGDKANFRSGMIAYKANRNL